MLGKLNTSYSILNLTSEFPGWLIPESQNKFKGRLLGKVEYGGMFPHIKGLPGLNCLYVKLAEETRYDADIVYIDISLIYISMDSLVI